MFLMVTACMQVAAKQRSKVILMEEKILIFKQQRHDPDNLLIYFSTFGVPSYNALDFSN